VCAVFVAVFAWERFNTPPSNRSSTRRLLYWSSCAGYIFTALALYTVLSVLLQNAPWRMFLTGGTGGQLPAPLIATLAMTTLLSSVPVLKTLDRSILSFFLDWGAIPGELKRRAATMTTRIFSVTADDVAKLRKTYRDGAHGENLAEHLRSSGTDGLESLEYRYTQVVKLYDGVRHLSHQPRYAAFFAGAGERFDQMEKSAEAFLDQSAAWLTLAASVQELDNQPVYAALMRERREAFVQNCRDKFSELALFLAGAVLRSELTESGIVRRLRLLGFEHAEPMNEPEFPIDSLTLLAFGVFLYLADLLPDSFGNLKGWMLVSWITLPSVMAFMIGLFVPHIYRSAHRAAAARRMAALRSAPESSPQGQLSEQLARVLVPAEAHDA
jgi:hypothetical protein